MESVLKMWSNQTTGKGKPLIWAYASATLSAAGSTNLNPSLPGGATGIPRKIKASGSVAAVVTLAISNTQEITVLVNPNAPAAEELIPDKAFPGAQNSVAVTVTTSGAGTVYVAVAFEP
jgi:hypothetical protein